jgi:TonB-dependent receptor
LAFALAAPATVRAQTVATARDTNDIVVIAQRQAKTARDEQRAAPNLVNIQSAETIAKYPDVNAAEAISRIPGVALSIDTSEGRFVNIRGLDGNFNGATFGGVVLLNTQPGGTYFNSAARAVEFDTIPIGAIDRIVVTKTGLPDHDAEGIGGTIELTPRTAVGIKRPFAEITLGGGLQTFSNHGLYRDEIVLGAPIGHRADGGVPFSFVVTQFLYNDRRSFDDIEAGYADNQPATPDKAFSALELRHYDYKRERFGYSGELDFTPVEGQRLFARASMAGYNEHGNRNRLEIDGLDAVTIDPANRNGFVATGASTVKTLRDYDETHRNIVLQVGGEHSISDMKFDWFGAYSRATYLKHYDYNSTFVGPTGLTVAYDNTTDPDHPRFNVLSGANIVNTGNYALDSINNQRESDRDREWSAAANLTLPLRLAEDDQLKFGVKLRFRRKSAAPINFGSGYAGPSVGLAQFTNVTSIDNFYGLYPIGQEIDRAKVGAYLAANPSLFPDYAAGNPIRDARSSFDDTENVIAGYAQYQATLGRLGLLAGLRVESTHSVLRGNANVTDATGMAGFVPTSKTQNYTNFFPTVQLKYSIMPSLVARATYSTGIARPGFYQTIQSGSIDVGAQTASTGNPNLKPIYANNFDVALEYYLPNNGLLSLGLFDKELKNYIATRTFRGVLPGFGGLIFNQSSFQNLPGAYARGIEAAAVYKFAGLPGFLNGFGVDANASYVDSSVQLRDGEGRVALPGTFKYTANGALFYEAHRLQLRTALQYESAVLFGIGGSRATDVFQDKRLTVDFNGSYALSRRVSFYFNAKNLTNAPLRFYEGSRNRPIQREYYDVTLEGGVKLKL